VIEPVIERYDPIEIIEPVLEKYEPVEVIEPIFEKYEPMGDADIELIHSLWKDQFNKSMGNL